MDITPQFVKNMLHSTLKTRVENPDEISSPVVFAIQENTEAIKDPLLAKGISKPIVTALVDVIESNKEISKTIREVEEKRDSEPKENEKIDELLEHIESLKGDKGDAPTEEEIIELIKPLIPEPIPGDPGKDYVLTDKDKKEIANTIKVPVVEKIVEHQFETIIEKQPIVTNEIKEVAVSDTAQVLKEKLESLEDDDRLDAKAIKGLPKTPVGGWGHGIKRIDGASDTRIITPANGQTLVFNSARGVWENANGGTGGGHTIEDEGTPLTQRTNLNFAGAGVSVTDDAGNDATVVTITSGGGSGVVVSVVGGNGIGVDSADAANPIITLDNITGYIQQGTSITFTGTGTFADPYVINGTGGINRTIVITSTSQNMGEVLLTDYVYLVAGAHTITVPTAIGNTNRYTVKNNHSAAITVDCVNAETIDGTTSIQVAPQDSVDLISDNTNWFVI